MRKTYRVCFFVVALGGLVFGQFHSGSAGSGLSSDSDEYDWIVATGTNDNRAMEHLEYLCKEIGARPAGSRQHHAAGVWAMEKFRQFGLDNVHLEKAGEIPLDRYIDATTGKVKENYGTITFHDSGSEAIPIYNVVADITGSESPDEYIIVGAHFDSVPVGEGATDNGTGIAAVMEAARLLSKSGARPRRTIRFILFAGEESGLIGSRGYVEAHPELLPKISAMYNMDRGTHYISGVPATEPLREDIDQIFSAVSSLDPGIPFQVKLVEYLPQGDPDCCLRSALKASPVEDGSVILTRAFKENPDGTLEPLDEDVEKLLAAIAGGEPVPGDSLGKKYVLAGACAPGCGDGAKLSVDDLKALGLTAGDEGSDAAGTKKKMVAMGGSDHVPFLTAGIPAFWWYQEGDSTVAYPAHTEKDIYERVSPEYLEYSATVIAIGALGTANLDHMLSREKLVAPLEVEEDGGNTLPSIGCNPGCVADVQ